jgi:pimeloyl-ACP methyl ester carboxylesterase
MQNIEIIEKTSSIRRLETSWLEAGERGKPILFFCHGFPDDAHTWNLQMQFFSKDFHVIAPFVRGCEGSEKAEDIRRYGRDGIVLDHLEILSQVSEGREPVICIGHDLGVVHAMTLGRRLGDRLRGMIAINGLDLEMFARRLHDPGQVFKSWYMGFMQIPVLPEALAIIAPHTSQWLVKTLAGGASDLANSGFDRRTVGPLNQYRAFARETVTGQESQPRLTAPVLVLWGRDDGVLVAPTQSEWDRVAFHSTIRIIPGGHWLHRDHADQVTSFINSFICESLGSKPYDE